MAAFEQLWDFCATMDAITLPSQRDSPMSAQATGWVSASQNTQNPNGVALIKRDDCRSDSLIETV